MDINAALVDQRITKLVEDRLDALAGQDKKLRNDSAKLRSRAFVALCVQSLLDLPLEDAFELLTDASHDLAIDALHLGDRCGDEFNVTLFQGKYRKKLDGTAAFPANDVLKMVQTVSLLFDPNATYDMQTPLAPQIEEIRGLVRDGFFPTVRVVLCNNGARWRADGDAHVEAAGFDDNEQVSFEHFNHADVIELLKTPKKVSDTLRLHGAAFVEDFDFRRVLVGKMRVTEVADLLERHGEKLLEKNIRRYLGLRSNRVNKAIAETLTNPDQRGNFYFFNNGITFVCNNLRHNALQKADFQVRVEDLQIINGGQTCVTIQRTLANLDPVEFENTFVIVRLYELAEDDRDIVRSITYATNSQNPVDLRDLRANDPVQERLAMGLADLGYTYLRKRGQPRNGKPIIRPKEAAEASMAVLAGKPHIARFQSGALFGRWYSEAFPEDLVPAQIAFAVEVVRAVKQCMEAGLRRDPIEGLPDPPRWLPYGQLAIAALVGQSLGKDVDHLGLPGRLQALQASVQDEYLAALDIVDLFVSGHAHLGRSSLQKLSAAFRRSGLTQSVETQRSQPLNQQAHSAVLAHLDDQVAQLQGRVKKARGAAERLGVSGEFRIPLPRELEVFVSGSGWGVDGTVEFFERLKMLTELKHRILVRLHNSPS